MSVTVFQNARIVDPSRGIDETGTVIVDGRKIVAAGAAALNQGAPEGATVVDCRGKAIIPGLVDCTRLHRRARRRASRDHRIGEPGGGRRRRHLDRHDARHRSGHRRHRAGRARAARRARHGARSTSIRPRRSARSSKATRDDRVRPAARGRRGRLHRRAAHHRQFAR